MFTDDYEYPSNESYRTVGRDPHRRRSAGLETPGYHTMVDTPASGQCNFSAPLSSRDGLKYTPRESVDHRESPLAALVEVRRLGPAQPPVLQEIRERYKRVLTELRVRLEHECNRRHELLTTVRRLRTDREKDRSDFEFAQLDNER